MKIDEDLVELVKAIGNAVEDLPEAVQARAFELLLEHHLAARGREGGAGHGDLTTQEPMQARTAEPDWARILAQAGGVRPEQVQHLLSLEDEGFSIITPELGDADADRNRNIAVLVVWAARVVNRDLYYPTTEVRRVLRQLDLPTTNLHNNLRPEPCLRSVRVRGQRMLQLTGDWNQRVRDIFDSFTR